MEYALEESEGGRRAGSASSERRLHGCDPICVRGAMARPSATSGVSRRRAHAALPHLSLFCRFAGTATSFSPSIADVGVPNTVGGAYAIVGPWLVASSSILIRRSLTHHDCPLRRLNRWPRSCHLLCVWRGHVPRADDMRDARNTNRPLMLLVER